MGSGRKSQYSAGGGEDSRKMGRNGYAILRETMFPTSSIREPCGIPVFGLGQHVGRGRPGVSRRALRPKLCPNRLQNQLQGLLEASLGGPGRVLGGPGGVLEGSWGGLGASRGCLGAFWGRLGALGPPPRRPGTPQTGMKIDIWRVFGGVWARGGNLTEGGTLDNPGQSNIQRTIKQSIGQ